MSRSKNTRSLGGRKTNIIAWGLDPDVWQLWITGYNYTEIAKKINKKYPSYPNISYLNVRNYIQGVEAERYPIPRAKKSLDDDEIMKDFTIDFMNRLNDKEAKYLDEMAEIAISTGESELCNRETKNSWQHIKYYFLPFAQKVKNRVLIQVCDKYLRKLESRV